MGDTVSSYSATRPVPQQGTELGQYRIVKLLGAGGMGQVFLAEHKKLGRKVALKLLLPEFAGNPEVVGRFFHEAKAVNQINHEHIVEIVDFVEEPGGYNYFIMELLDGRDLAKAREDDGPFLLGNVIHVVGQMCSALAASHSKGIVHRDLKPENVFLIRRGEDPNFVKLLDFGIAKLSSAELTDKPQTRAGMILGTPEYMSPEQAGGRPIDYRSDIYSLGVVLYWLLSDQLPYRGKSFGELMVKQLTTPPEALPERTPGGQPIPPALAQLVGRCLEREPQNRIQSAGEIAEALERLGGGTTGAAARLPSPAKPRRWLVPSIAAGAAVGLLAAFGFWKMTGGSGTEASAAASAEPSVPPAAPQAAAPTEPAPRPAVVPAGIATNAPTPNPAVAPVPSPVQPTPPPAPAIPPIKVAKEARPSKPKAARPRKHKATGEPEPTSSPDDNTGMIDPFAN
ncbi:MAG: serine/threonine protein kinase [Deltaproteobacteria bacterium]